MPEIIYYFLFDSNYSNLLVLVSVSVLMVISSVVHGMMKYLMKYLMK